VASTLKRVRSIRYFGVDSYHDHGTARNAQGTLKRRVLYSLRTV